MSYKKSFNLIILSIFTFAFTPLFSQSDNCATATVLTLDATGNVCVTGTTINATSANMLYGSCNPVLTNNEVWYTFVTNGPTNVFDVTPQGLSNPEIIIYTGGCGATLETCDNLTGTTPLSTSWGIPTGTQVWIGIMSNQGNEGNFDFCINSTAAAPGGGNACAGAIPICDPIPTISVDMNSMTSSGVQPSCFGGTVNQDVWFQFTVTQSGTFEWSAIPSGISTGVELDWALFDITASCPGTEIDCNYNYTTGANGPAGQTPGGTGEFNPPSNLIAGNTYAIIIDFFSSGAIGDLDFNIDGGSALIQPLADFTINPSGPTCATNLNVTITDNSIGIPTYDFGDGSPTFTGNNPPIHSYSTPGTYAITASIGGACPSTHTEFVELFGPVVVVPTTVIETCAGDCDGSISLATSGGSGIYTYLWSPGAQTTPTINGLCANNYSVTVTDAVCGNIVQPITLATGPICVTCAMDSLNITMTNCNNNLPTLTYDVSGVVYYSDPPTTGVLTITDCNGGSQVFPAPFGASQAFTFTGLPHTGNTCDFTAVFSDDIACTITSSFMSPAPIIGFSMSTGSCINNTFMVNGDITFSNPPTTGTLTISVNDGTSNYDTIINAPFSSPENWSISGIPTGGGAFTVTYYWSGFPSCTQIANGTAPASCGCVADIGTFTSTITPNNGQNPYVLCFGDEFSLLSNGDMIPPDEALSPPISAPGSYNPGIGYLIYSCPPTIATVPSNIAPNDNITNDPCFVGIAGFGNDFNDINFLGGPSYAGAFTNNTIYYVPITFYDTIGNPATYSYVNTNMPCYSMGQPFAVQYLTQITSSQTPNCQDSSVTVIINGGLPETDASLYTASNLLPSSANFVNTTTTHGGSIIINGLQNGDMYSFDISDTNGCPITITGGPFIGLPNANANVNDTSCTLTYTLNATPSFGVGTWTGPAGAIYTPNANDENATVTVPAAGIYTFTWTEDNSSGCTSSDDVEITFNIVSIPNTPTNPTCNNETNGQIVLAPQGGVPPYSYLWNPAAGNQTTNPATNLGAGNFTVTVTDNFGCSQDSTFILSEPTPFTFTTASNSANCGQPDGWVAVNGFNGGTAPYTYDWGAGPTNNDTLFNLIPGVYFVTVNDAAAPTSCDTTFTISVANTPGFTANITSFTDALCKDSLNGTATAAGSDPVVIYSYNWYDAGNQTTQTAINLGVGIYNVELTDPNTGCTDTVDVTISEPSLVTVSANPISICLGQTASLTATGANGSSGGYTYNWDNGIFIGSPYFVSPVVNTVYSVFAIDINGCPSAPINVNVSVSDPLIANTSQDVSICIGSSTTISAQGSFGNGGPYTYNWDNGLPPGQTQTVSPIVTTTYTATIDDGCTTPLATSQVTVTVNPLPIISFTVDTFSLCETPTQAFEFSTDTTGGMYSAIFWDFGDGITGTLDTVSHTYPSPGTYDVSLTLTSSIASGSCIDTLIKTNYIQVFADPIADFTYNPLNPSMLNPTVNFIDQSYINIQFWDWSFDGLGFSNDQNPTFTFPEDTGAYLVMLTVTDINNCVSSTSNIVNIIGEYAIYLPNSFTPNGDGLNDGFLPFGFGINDRNYSFIIFDRWGEKIFESHNKFEPWLGDYKGSLVPNDVYIWQLFFEDINGKKHSDIGRVTVVR